MSTNKNAMLRFQVLDRCFSNTGRNYTLDDLVNECNKALSETGFKDEGIKRRQLYNDISFMESTDGWSVELERFRVGRKIAFRYTDSKFSINNQPLNTTELQYIQDALQILSRFSGVPQFEWVNEMLPRLQKSFNLEPDAERSIEFESNVYLQGMEHLRELFNAILYKKVLNILYRPFNSATDHTYEIHPCFLKQYNGRWFLFAYNTVFRKLSNFAIDRIVQLTDSGKSFKPHKEFDFTEYFENIIGVTLPEKGKIEKIELWFSPFRAPYVISKPLHGTQKKIRNDEAGLLISLEIIPNPELTSLILSFGSDIEVRKPVSLRRQIAKELKNSMDRY